MGKRWLCLLALTSCLAGEDLPAADREAPLITAPGAARAPCPRGSGQCVDLYFATHEDDDLLFMNPDIASSIRAGNRVVVTFVTAGDISLPGWGPADEELYWTDRERGIMAAYARMTNPADAWTGQVATIAGKSLARYDRPGVTLLFLRLRDVQLESLWEDGGEAITEACTDPSHCPLGTTMAAATYTKAGLLDALAAVMSTFQATSIAAQDATGVNHAVLFTPQADGFADYWDHYFSSLFVLSAATRYQAASATAKHLRLYRGYTVDQEHPNLSAAQAVAKGQIFAAYAQWDGVPQGLEPPDPGILDPSRNRGRWLDRLYDTRTLLGTGPLQGRLSITNASGQRGCLGASGSTPVTLYPCASAPSWTITAQHQLQQTGTTSCLTTVAGSSSLTMAPCTPRTERNTLFLFSNGQLRAQEATCISASATSNGAPSYGPCDKRCIDESTGLDAPCGAANAGPSGRPDLLADWTLLFDTPTLVSTQFSNSTEIDGAAYYYRTFGIANQNVCVRRSNGVHCAAASGGGLAPATVLGTEYTDALGWNQDSTGSTVSAVWNPATSTTMACGRGYFGAFCTSGNSTAFATPDGWASAAYYYGSIRYPDVNGDGKPDICGRGDAGISCAVNQGSSFAIAASWSGEFSAAKGWNVVGTGDTIQFGDVNGDGITDVCGRGEYGIDCALGTGFASFSAYHPWSFDADRRSYAATDPSYVYGITREFSTTDPVVNWKASSAYYASIELVDVNRDGLADVCGRGPGGIYCAFSVGNGFDRRRLVEPEDFTDALGWSAPSSGATISFGDLDGDARVDVCGRGIYGVMCAEGY